MTRHHMKVLLLVAVALCACEDRSYSRAVVFGDDVADAMQRWAGETGTVWSGLRGTSVGQHWRNRVWSVDGMVRSCFT